MQTVYDMDHNDLSEPGKRRQWPLILLGILLVLLIGGGLLIAWVRGQINPSGAPGREVKVTVTKGMSIDSVASLLERQGVIGNATVFTYYARFQGAGTFQAGDFTLRANEDMGRVIDILEDGPRIETDKLTIPEGLNIKEVASRVAALPGRSADKFVALASSGTVRSKFQSAAYTGLEGFLMPETYLLDRKDDESKILTKMVSEFDETATELGIVEGAAQLNLTPEQVVVVASLIEREARVDEERAKIARVIYNRLARNMPLQIDATIQYALGKQKASLLNRDLEIQSPYNTYKFKGLPPGAIASPGRKSLQAALNPTPGDWLYYVLADENGRHNFAETSAQFEKFKAEAQAKGLL